VLSAVSLAGAIRMWKLHRDGFIFYSIAQLGMTILPVIWLGWNSFTVPGAIFTGVFVGGYTLNLKKMKSDKNAIRDDYHRWHSIM